MTEPLLPLAERAGMRQADVARLLDLSPATVSRMFDGHRELTLPEARKLVAELRSRGHDVSLDELLEETKGAS